MTNSRHDSNPRKDSFVPLRLGPVGRARTFMDSLATPSNYVVKESRPPATPIASTETVKYPRIIVRDLQGRSLDTFTTLQDAIYRASWNRKHNGGSRPKPCPYTMKHSLLASTEYPKAPLEWRLPKAPVPSRPDYTRACPPRAMTSVQLQGSAVHRRMRSSSPGSTSASYGKSRRIDLTTDVLVDVPVLEIPVEDVSFVAQSLQHLPELPSFSFLRHSFLAGQSTYVQIVASILLHQRLLKEPDTRAADWEFPGFCSGCKRAGFCYGCSKNPKPHIHEDIPAMTGGGFRFWKPDRPRNPHAWKNPNNWKLPATEHELQEIIKKYGGLAAYERAVIAARREIMTTQYDVLSELASQGKLSDGKKLERITTLSSYPPQVTIISTEDLEADDEVDEDADALVESMLEGYSILDEAGDAENDDTTSRRKRSRQDGWMRNRDRSRSEETFGRRDRSRSQETQETLESRRRRIGVTSYKDDVASTTSRSTRNIYEGSGTSVRIDTGPGEDLEEDGEMGGSKLEGDDTSEDVKVKDGKGQKVSIVEPPDTEVEESRGRRLSRLSRSSRTQSQSVGRLSVTQRSASSGSRSSWMTSRGTAVQDEEEAEDERKRRERPEGSTTNKEALQTIPFARKRKETLYKAPKFFTVQKRSRKITAIQDPFSKDREFDIPKGPGFQIKKGERKETKFLEFKRQEHSWTAPKAFALKKADRKEIKFWAPKKTKADDDDKKRRRAKSHSNERSRQRQRGGHSSPDSGLHSATDKENLEPTPEPQVPVQDKSKENARSGAKMDTVREKAILIRTLSPDSQDATDTDANAGKVGLTDGQDKEEVLKPKRREIVKKSKVERQRPPTPPKNPPRLPSPPQFKRRPTPPPTPPTQRTPTPPRQIQPPDFDLPSVPDLPDIKDREAEPRKQKMKFMVEAPPALQEVPKKRRAAPKVRILPKHLSRHRRTKPAEAPVSQDDLTDITDPLDFLAKYCIINPDRLPFYEIIFETTVADQDPIYEREEKKSQGEEGRVEESGEEGEGEKKGKKKGKSKKKKAKSAEEKKHINPDLILANKGIGPEKALLTAEEQHLEKIIYKLELLQNKLIALGMQLEDMENNRLRILADKARELFPEVTAPDYHPKAKKKGKKGKKSKSPVEPPRKLRPHEITDEIIVARLDDKMLTELSKELEVRQLNTEMTRARDKIADIQKRVEEMASERLLADAFCMNHFFLRQGLTPSGGKTGEFISEFKRQQSELYNRLHPSPDFEMNFEEVEGALQQINNHLLTEKEVFFLYSILNLPRREKINFRLFSIIAALSEKVTQLDPVIKKLINNFNYNALDVKMEKCKELFDLLEADDIPKGGALASSLAVELNAGGLKPEHTRHVLHKFNRENRGVVDFLDFVTYVPLFVEIHKRIIEDPLRQELDL